MSRKSLVTLVPLILLLSQSVTPQELPTYTCRYATSAPVVDGRGEDPAWQAAEAVSLVDVRYLSGDHPHSQATQVQMLWDDEQFYVLFVSQDPDVWSTLADRDDPLWDQEVVEVFFDPNGDEQNYVEIEVNPINTVVDLLVTKPFRDGGKAHFEWSPQFQTAVHVEGTANDPSDVDETWSMEMAAPWSIVNADLLDVPGPQSVPPKPGDEWRFNFYRYERIREAGVETGVIEYSAWSPVGEINFHRPDRFGIVVFAGPSTAIGAATWGHVKGADRQGE